MSLQSLILASGPNIGQDSQSTSGLVPTRTTD